MNPLTGFSDVFSEAFAKSGGVSNRAVGAIGIPAPDFPAPSLTRSVNPDGIESAAHGATTIWNKDRFVAVPGASHFLSGTARVWNLAQFASPPGFDAFSGGEATVWDYRRSLEVAGIAPPLPGFGVAEFILRNRYVDAPGLGHSEGDFGSASVTHAVRGLWALGASFAVTGQPRVELRNRVVAPASIWRDWASNHLVGGSRTVEAQGWDSASFGSRIVPEITAVYSHGFVASLFPEPRIWNLRQMAAPAGFLSVGVQPEDRWGRAQVWNSRQFITVQGAEGDGLSPPPWPIWTKIANRNRTILTYGQSSERFGYTRIDNAARPLLPRGMDSFAPGRAMVAFRVREIPVEGMASPYMASWHRVHNDARVVSPASFRGDVHGRAALVNTRRYYKFQGFESEAFGAAMVAFRVRELTFEGRYGIHPPAIPLPEVKLYTRYVDGVGTEMFRSGSPALEIHWTRIVPRWTVSDRFGWAALRNVTPEVHQRGRNSEEFGDASVRLEWRRVTTRETFTQAFGRPAIADTRRTLFLDGVSSLKFGDRLKVEQAGTPPYALQRIEGAGGIGPEEGREAEWLGKPDLNSRVIYVLDDGAMTRFGSTRMTANSIRVEPGYADFNVGKPDVSWFVRTLTQAHDEKSPDALGKPRVSPHTIYAPMEAPEQAQMNHPESGQPNYVNEGEVFGEPTVTLRHRNIFADFAPYFTAFGVPAIDNARRYVKPDGIRAYRFGWHALLPHTETLEQFKSTDFMIFGLPKIAPAPYEGTLTVGVHGFDAFLSGENQIELFNRTILARGTDMSLLGTKLAQDSPYMWQGLRVGPLMPTIPAGEIMEAFGEAWISHRVREVLPEGFDPALVDYELEAFDKRLRVSRGAGGGTPSAPPRRVVTPEGIGAPGVSLSNVDYAVRYIRPDGNADQFRKGVQGSGVRDQ